MTNPVHCLTWPQLEWLCSVGELDLGATTLKPADDLRSRRPKPSPSVSIGCVVPDDHILCAQLVSWLFERWNRGDCFTIDGWELEDQLEKFGILERFTVGPDDDVEDCDEGDIALRATADAKRHLKNAQNIGDRADRKRAEP